MILGRTPEGLIKIKKDDPLGLRAVNCACCGCGCAVSLPQSIRTLADNATATSFSFNGVSPVIEDFDEFYRFGPDSWYALLFFIGFGTEIFYVDGCLQFLYSYGNPPDVGFAETGNPEVCAFPLDSSTVTGNFTINGITGFDYYYYTDEGQIPVPPPVIVFT